MMKMKMIELTLCALSLFASGPLCARGGLEGFGGPENACAAAATRPTSAWSLFPAAVVDFPDTPGLEPAWLIPAASKREAAAGFFVIARCAAVAAAEFPVPLVLLAWPIPAARRRDAAAGFFVMARWAAPAMADV